ncbi:uncharacterized protein ARMOST_02203 [Armillaria ostoyae]|uniref:Uncharacterized protein n=1 Tax=Armillaria ostoyae TaxID=47428 RepID=A0A284QR36_ARMOS|nr:uncharacterized protein ARMOST_02203 [Armillaria ostoyae]
MSYEAALGVKYVLWRTSLDPEHARSTGHVHLHIEYINDSSRVAVFLSKTGSAQADAQGIARARFTVLVTGYVLTPVSIPRADISKFVFFAVLAARQLIVPLLRDDFLHGIVVVVRFKQDGPKLRERARFAKLVTLARNSPQRTSPTPEQCRSLQFSGKLHENSPRERGRRYPLHACCRLQFHIAHRPRTSPSAVEAHIPNVQSVSCTLD